MKGEIADRYKVMFIVFVSLGVYYPSLFGQVNSLDDYELITAFINTEHIDWKGFFFPMTSFYYYRPLLLLSFLFDRFIFDCSASFMHLINILLHTMNGVLIFFIVKEMRTAFKLARSNYVPVFASLFFLLHPINTEAVNWISARTDILAGTFVFLSFLVFLKKGIDNYFWCCFSALIYIMGLFSKEVALGFLPFIALFLVLKEGLIEKLSVRRRLALLIPFLFMTVTYFVMRAAASGHTDNAMAAVSKVTDNLNVLTSLSSAIKAFGFYVKKLFIPVPLNFGIIEIHRTFYFWFGMITASLALYLLSRKRSLTSFLFLSAILFFLPAIPIAVSGIAWTPLGERYLYLSSFGASVLVVVLISRIPARKELIYGSLTFLLVTAAIITTSRNIIWQTNLTLYEDTVKKSPTFAAARNQYGMALADRGRSDEALEQFGVSARLAGHLKNGELPSLNIIALTRDRKDFEKMKHDYLELLDKFPPESSKKILQKIIKILDSQIIEEKNPAKQKALYWESISYIERLFKVEKDGFYPYRIGQFYLALGEKRKAAEYFTKAVELAPNQFFSEPARKLIKRLNETTD